MNPVNINCASGEWKLLLRRNLQEELDLSNFDYTPMDVRFCELLAWSHEMVFSLDANRGTGHFRKNRPRGLGKAKRAPPLR